MRWTGPEGKSAEKLDVPGTQPAQREKNEHEHENARSQEHMRPDISGAAQQCIPCESCNQYDGYNVGNSQPGEIGDYCVNDAGNEDYGKYHFQILVHCINFRPEQDLTKLASLQTMSPIYELSGGAGRSIHAVNSLNSNSRSPSSCHLLNALFQ